MPRKGMRTLCFTTSKSPSYSMSSHSDSSSSSPSRFSFSPTPSPSFTESAMERSILTAEPLIEKWNSETSPYAKVTSLFYESKREALEFITSVNNLQKTMHYMLSENSSSQHLIRAQQLMQVAMTRLQKEFYQILSTNRAHLDPESVSARSSRASTRSSTSDYYDDVIDDDNEIRVVGDSISEVEQVSILAMDNLKLIAECMISSGYGKECVKIYSIIRKSIIDEGIYKLGVEKSSVNQFNKMDHEVQEMKIKNWLGAVKIAVRTLFTGEKILCDHVFASSDSIRESCFAEISKQGAIILFGFPENIAKGKKFPEKMFRTLDMYTAISENWPEIESIFSSESTSTVRSQALNSLIKIGESVRTMLADFESVVQKDSSKSMPHGGGVHQMTHFVMNYLSLLGDYSNILSDIVLSPPPKSAIAETYLEFSDSDHESQAQAPAPAISVHIAWLILVLLCKLDGKSKHYKDVSLSYLFLTNNLQHIVSKVRTSNLKYILGDEWISKHETKIRQFSANYERLGWSDVYSSLPEHPSTAVISPEEAKEWFVKFNSSFDDAYRKQSSYVIPDPKLRDEIRVSIAKKIVMVYREMYDSHRLSLGGRGGERNVNLKTVIRFAPEDVANYLSDLFYGNGESVVSAAASSSSSSPSNGRLSRHR